jgi:uncharacterized protein (TIGR02186 family)
MRRGLLLPLVALAAFLPAAARAERLVTSLSNPEVEISSSFAGEKLTMFGNIEPDVGVPGLATGPFHVLIVIEGPLQSRVTRQESSTLGIWSNTDQVVFKDFPSYYHVLADTRLNDVASVIVLSEKNILPEDRARQAAQATWWKATIFSRELVRLMTQKGLIGVEEQGVQFLSDTAYTARVTLPSDITNGRFIAHTYVFRQGTIVAEDVEGFTVRKVGFELFLGNAARQYPLPYGLVCVLLAIGTGWLGGVVFRR